MYLAWETLPRSACRRGTPRRRHRAGMATLRQTDHSDESSSVSAWLYVLKLQRRCWSELRCGDSWKGCGGYALHRSSSAEYLKPRPRAYDSRRPSAARSQSATWRLRRAVLSDIRPRGWRLFRRFSAFYDPFGQLRFRCKRHSRASPTHSTEKVNHAQDHPADSRCVRVEKDAIPHLHACSRALFGFHALNRLLLPAAAATIDRLMKTVADSFEFPSVAVPASRAGDRIEFSKTNVRRAPFKCAVGTPNDERFRPAHWAINCMFRAEGRDKHDAREPAQCICDG